MGDTAAEVPFLPKKLKPYTPGEGDTPPEELI